MFCFKNACTARLENGTHGWRTELMSREWNSRVPLLCILDAVLTVSPNRQYLGALCPMIPATHGPAEDTRVRERGLSRKEFVTSVSQMVHIRTLLRTKGTKWYHLVLVHMNVFCPPPCSLGDFRNVCVCVCVVCVRAHITVRSLVLRSLLLQ